MSLLLLFPPIILLPLFLCTTCGGPFCVLGWIAPAVLRPYDSRVGETAG